MERKREKNRHQGYIPGIWFEQLEWQHHDYNGEDRFTTYYILVWKRGKKVSNNKFRKEK